ncbi:hypothetical protein [Novosphingobium jiangmenense]|uniref:Nicotinamide riboside transporter PnuC n=1 Tax=Novosphingobium jiangmenense TaxID=2791981 RepID=A0ABS0HD53_9SPHN|nr:hypothetical protein [Novosphingobium jiangmenense]MBF9150197.1 hypothetical protein [Novosphingobium jiangmenense]
MDGPIEWFAAIGKIIAAGLVAADIGRRWTGWGFVLFVAVALSWIASGMINGAASLVIQNGALVIINAWGVWRYLLNPERGANSGK